MKKALIALLLLLSVATFALNQDEILLKKQHLADDSEIASAGYQRDFVSTSPPPAPVRPVAEFEPMSAVLVRWPLSIPASLVAELSQVTPVITLYAYQNQISQAQSTYQNASANMENIQFMQADTNSEWVRDYGPWFIVDGNNQFAVVDFPYNRPRPLDDEVARVFAQEYDLPLYGMEVVQTGGNYMCDGISTVAQTTLVYTESAEQLGLSQATVDQRMQDFMGATNYLTFDDPLGEYIEHIDCWGKFLGVDKILIGQVSSSDSRYNDYEEIADYFASATSGWGTPYRVYRVYSPGGNSYPTPYTNSLIINDHVFVPQSGSDYDEDAIEVYEEAMPGYTIVPVTYSWWYDTDALHCRTHEVPDVEMIYVQHQPYWGEQPYAQQYTINAHIQAYSGANFVNEQPSVVWRINGGEWQNSSLELSQEPFTWQGSITGALPGSTVEYYLHAQDQAGKTANHPYIGAADPHTFTVAADTQAPALEFTNPFGEQVAQNAFPYLLSATSNDNTGINAVTISYMVNNGVEQISVFSLDQGIWTCNWQPQAQAGETVTYSITATDLGGNSITSPQSGTYNFVIQATGTNQQNPALPTALTGANPNPFNPNTQIFFTLNSVQKVDLTVYNLKGQLVRRLLNGTTMQPGQHSIAFNGQNSNGHTLPSGLYLLRFKAGNTQQVGKVVLLK